MTKKAAAKETTAKKSAGKLTPKRTQGPHDSVPNIPGKDEAPKASTAAKPHAIDGFMNFPPAGSKPAPKK